MAASHRNKIYCIGDSHVSFFSGSDAMTRPWPAADQDKLPFFRTFRMGAVLAASLSKYGSSLKGRELLFVLLDRKFPDPGAFIVPPGSRVLFCFGEIDCRFHIIRKAEESKTDCARMAELAAKNYFDVISEVKSLGYQVAVWNVVPPTNPSRVNKEYPHYGTYDQRKKVTRAFNSYLKKELPSLNIPFVDVYDKLVSDNDDANALYYCDEIHLSQKAMPFALEELKKVFPETFVDSNSTSKRESGWFTRLFKKSR